MTERPVQEYRAGGVKAAIWENEGERGKFFTTTFTRSYRDDTTGEWKETGVFMPDQLPKLNLVIGKAYEFIQLGRGKNTPANDNHANDNAPPPEEEEAPGNEAPEGGRQTHQERVGASRQGGRRR